MIDYFLRRLAAFRQPIFSRNRVAAFRQPIREAVFAAVMVLAAACSGNGDQLTLLVGTYTGSGSEGIYVYKFDQAKGRLVHPADSITEAPGSYGKVKVDNPSFLIAPESGVVYAVSEMDDSTACLNAFTFDKTSGKFTLINSMPTGSPDPCYVSTNGKLVLTADYGGSLSAFPIASGGGLRQPQVLAGTVGGPDPKRQAVPHVHCAYFTPDGQHVLESNFSADNIVEYDVAGDSLVSTGTFFPLNADYGPRHITFSPDGKTCYVIGELSGDITVFQYNPDGMMLKKQVIKADPGEARGSADIHTSPDGKFLYASIRLQNDGISIFKIGDDGMLSPAGFINTGKHPRNFDITPNGRFLLCACRDSDMIQIFRRNTRTGELKDTGRRIHLSKPVCIVFN